LAGLLSGKNALVGGGSQGIGKACAMELARLGAQVTVMARDEKALAQVVASLDVSASQRHTFLRADFSNPIELQDKVTRHVQER